METTSSATASTAALAALLGAALLLFVWGVVVLPMPNENRWGFLWGAIPFAIGAGLAVTGFRRSTNRYLLRMLFIPVLLLYALMTAVAIWGISLRFF
jgi:hypothetical protein